MEISVYAYLSRVHLKLANYLDGHLTFDSLEIDGLVHIAEGAVAHLRKQPPSLQSRVSWQLPLSVVLFGYHACECFGVDLSLGPGHLWMVPCGMCGGMAGRTSGIIYMFSMGHGRIAHSCSSLLMCGDG